MGEKNYYIRLLSLFVCSEYKNAPYIGFYKFATPAIVFRDADLIKNVLVRDHHHFAGNDFPVSEKYDPLFYNNPFFLTGERWRLGRNVLVPTMTAGKVRSHLINNLEKIDHILK